MSKLFIKSLKVAGTLAVLFFIFYLFTWYGFREERQDIKFGVTFSTVMARQLGLDPRKVFDAIIDDLGARKIRLPIYWSDIEKEQGKFDFSDYDYFLRRAEEKNAIFILAIGRKLPRWPECHEPGWVQSVNPEAKHLKALDYIELALKRYDLSPAVDAWQVENEPFFRFGGECAKETIKPEYVTQEVDLVRSISDKPVIITDSGEQGWWFDAARHGDVLGITMYRQVYNDTLGTVPSPFGPAMYKLRRWFLEAFLGPQKMLVAELQAEPWGEELLPGDPIEFQKKLMNAEVFRKNISYARRTGFDIFYLWGSEWFYWLKEKQGDPSLWEEARKLLAV